MLNLREAKPTVPYTSTRGDLDRYIHETSCKTVRRYLLSIGKTYWCKSSMVCYSKRLENIFFRLYSHSNFFGQFCPRGKGAMRLTLCKAPTRESRPDHNMKSALLFLTSIYFFLYFFFCRTRSVRPRENESIHFLLVRLISRKQICSRISTLGSLTSFSSRDTFQGACG